MARRAERFGLGRSPVSVGLREESDMSAGDSLIAVRRGSELWHKPVTLTAGQKRGEINVIIVCLLDVVSWDRPVRSPLGRPAIKATEDINDYHQPDEEFCLLIGSLICARWQSCSVTVLIVTTISGNYVLNQTVNFSSVSKRKRAERPRFKKATRKGKRYVEINDAKSDKSICKVTKSKHFQSNTKFTIVSIYIWTASPSSLQL